MAAVFPVLVTIHRNDFSAVLAGNFVVGFSVHLVGMLIPPLIPALTAAEPLRFPPCVLLDSGSAVIAFCYVGRCYCCRLLCGHLLFLLNFLLLCFVLRRMEGRKGVWHNAPINQMHLCCAVFHDHDFVNDQ